VTSVRQGIPMEIPVAGRRTLAVLQLLAMLWFGGCGGVLTEIPDLNTPDGRVFAERCGACHGKPFGGHGITHGVPDPRFRTVLEWQEELVRMEALMREKGMPPLTEVERETISRYLNGHAKP
jgi:mono/diheme cytochrome c family protein